MEELLKKVVNLGIGAVKSLEEGLRQALEGAETGINDLIAKGEANNEEGAAKVRQVVEEITNSIKEYEAKAKEISESLTNALQDFDPQGKVDELKNRVDEVAEKIKTQVEQFTNKG